IFSSPPSPAVDAAWARMEKNMIIGLSRDELLALGKDPSAAVKFSPSWPDAGAGEKYLGVLDVFHQIHCLNMLRTNLVINYNYYWGDEYGTTPPVFRDIHLSHCVSVLLQSIACHADLGVVTHVWRSDTPVPYPDFGINRQCRDFDALVRWRDENDI
ncbi:hypothetical protein B0H67DRAFT_466207, partial [Lasiosphaeris hirsuta]